MFEKHRPADKVKVDLRQNDQPYASNPPPYSDKSNNNPNDNKRHLAFDSDHALAPPDIAAGFRNLNLSVPQGDFPAAEQAIVHLKLLACFYRHKQTISSQDGLFGIRNDMLPTADAQLETDQMLARLAEKRWMCYLHRAVDRFEVWWALTTPHTPRPTCNDLQDAGPKGTLLEPRAGLDLQPDSMPPIDVLMVWHSYMLNPRAYLQDCIRHGKMALWHTPIPWRAIDDCIDPDTFAYTPTTRAKHLWRRSGREWDNTDDADTKIIYCPQCQSVLQVPWTTCGQDMYSQKVSSPAAIDAVLSQGTGFCDKAFISPSCPSCHKTTTHDGLRVAKFCKDARLLIEHNLPMPGTILGLKGLPWRAFGRKDKSTDLMHHGPNSMLLRGLGADIIRDKCADMAAVRRWIELALVNPRYMAIVSGTGGMKPHERIGVRKMMSCYWENSSTFALDLVGAVVRQGSFVEKMYNIDWLHSPALRNTMNRLLEKYRVFVKIMSTHNRMAVPTLDVDLAWHTHQLFPYQYAAYTVASTKQFVDHDDKVTETKLNDAFAWTSKAYTTMTGEPYSECTCWYCEAVRESTSSSIGRLLGSKHATAGDKLIHTTDQDPRKSVHISAHNAVRPTDDAAYTAQSTKRAKELESAYERACARAVKRGKPVPRRDDYYYSEAYGVPVYIPAYAPFVGGVPYTPGLYPNTPGCMALGVGSVGNCCTGTCGGTVGSGSCASGMAAVCFAGFGVGSACGSSCGAGAAGSVSSSSGGGCGGGGSSC